MRVEVNDCNLLGLVARFVRSGKGDKDRITALPETVIPALRHQIEVASLRWQRCDVIRPPLSYVIRPAIRTHLENWLQNFQWMQAIGRELP